MVFMSDTTETLTTLDLLIVEDEKLLGRAIERGLTEAGNRCTWTRSGADGLHLASTQNFDALVLDLMLPDLEGLELLDTLRRAGRRTPVLVLTALGSIDDRVKGLNSGADDYLVKPFEFPELLARLHALVRRSSIRPAMSQEVGPLKLDLSTRKVTRSGREIDLSPTEFSVLEFLLRHHDTVVTRKMLNQHLWGEDWGSMSNIIDVHINRLRRKVDRGYDQPLIQTVRGRGYVLRTV
jgi:two-component system OmpR family response regulator/two-component system copper resistance phosphate regulon response regulator CusR